MVIALDTGQVADLVFVIEGTANMGAYLGELKANYVIPTLECFNGGPAEDKECGSELTSTLYALIVFMAADSAPEPSVTCGSAPTTSISKFLSWLDRIPFLGGAAEGCSHIVEGLGTALQAFDDFHNLREPHLTTQKHCILICNSPPYPLPCFESTSYSGYHAEQLASMMGERGINLSIISPRKIPALFKLYDKAGGDLTLAQNKNYTKDRRHLVLLKGYQLQERPLSPNSVELKEKPQLLPGAQISSVIQPEKTLIPSNALAPAGSPGTSALLQSQPKGPIPNQQHGHKRPPGGSPPAQPPFKQHVTPGNMVVPVGLGPQQQMMPQPTALSSMPPMGPQSQPQLNPNQQPMPSVPSSIPSLPQLPMQNAKASQQMGRGGGGSIRGGPLPPSQPAQMYMNQPNPPNVTISRSVPLPQPISQLMDTSGMVRPLRDQAPGPRPMTWNPPQSMGPGSAANHGPVGGGMGPGVTGPPNQTIVPPVSQLVQRLQTPVRGSSSVMGVNQRSGVDVMVNRAPNVTAGPAGHPNAGPGSVMNIMPPGSRQGGPVSAPINQPPNVQGVGPNSQKNLPGQLNIGPPLMPNQPASMQNQLGAQGPRYVLLQPGNGIQHMPPNSLANQQQMGNQPITSMAPSMQQQQNMLSSGGPMGQQALPGIMNPQISSNAGNTQGSMPQQPQQPGQQAPPQPQPSTMKERRVVWQGVVEWQEKPKIPNDPTAKINRQVQCQVSSAVNAIGEPEVNADKWPKKLIMQLIPKILMQHFGSAFLKSSRNVIFHFNSNLETAEALANLNKVMSNGFIGCVHFSPQQNAPSCDIRILMLIYSTDKHTYVGFIPNDQIGFVSAIRNVISKKQQSVKQQQQQQAAAALQQHVFGPQGTPNPQQMNQGQMNPNLAGNMGLPISGPPPAAGGPNAGLHSVSGPPSGGLPNIPNPLPGQVGIPGGPPGPGGAGIGAMQNPQQQGHMVSHPSSVGNNSGTANNGPQGGGSGGAGSGTSQPGAAATGPGQGALERQLEAERQQNLLKIQQLQESLQAAKQKDMQLKAAQEHQKQQIVHPGCPSDIFQQLQPQQPPPQQQQQQPQQQQRILHGGNTQSTNNPHLRHLLQLRQLQMMQQQVPGPRPPMAPGQIGQPGMVAGAGQQQPGPNAGNMFGDDLM